MAKCSFQSESLIKFNKKKDTRGMESGTQRAASRLRGLLFTFDFSPFDCSDLRSANWDLRWRWGVGGGGIYSHP